MKSERTINAEKEMRSKWYSTTEVMASKKCDGQGCATCMYHRGAHDYKFRGTIVEDEGFEYTYCSAYKKEDSAE